MITIKGRSVFGSIARGKLTFYRRDEFIINKIKVSDPELEYKKYVKAKNAALVELGELYERARTSVGESDAQIFVIHQMLITDEQYDGSVRTLILDEHFNADYAVAPQEALRKCLRKWTANICKAERLTSKTFQTDFCGTF